MPWRKWKWKVKGAQSCLTLCDPMDYTIDGILQVRILEWVAFPFSKGSSLPRDWTQVSRVAGRFFTSWAPRKPKKTGVGSLSLLQQIFLTQESNGGLLHCRWILYQPSNQEKPPWRREQQPTPVLLPGKSHGQRSLAGYSPRGRKELDATERLRTAQHCTFSPSSSSCRQPNVPSFVYILPEIF